MGTDIHGVFQKLVDEAWIDVPSTFERDRDYDLFAHLADVRNGSGFAGVLTGARVEPISLPRGLPDDFEVLDDNRHPISNEIATYCEIDYREPGEPVTRWMGDHSHSWLTGEEILAHNFEARDWKTGIISVETFRAWDGVSSPQSWCGGIAGLNVVIAENPCLVDDKATHVRVYWRQGGDRFTYFTDEVRRLVDEHGAIRFVFGFDS